MHVNDSEDMDSGIGALEMRHVMNPYTSSIADYGVRRFKEWLAKNNTRDNPTDLGKIDSRRLNILLMSFWENFSGNSNEAFGRSALIEIRGALSRQFRDLKRTFDIINGEDFISSNEMFNQKCNWCHMKSGNEKTMQKIPTKMLLADLTKLEIYFSDLTTPKRLQQYIWFNIMYFFSHYLPKKDDMGFRAMKKNALIIHQDSQGLKYITNRKIEEMESEIEGEGCTRDQDTPVIRLYSTGGALDPVEAFENYTSRLSSSCSSLWQVPKTSRQKAIPGRFWYRAEPLCKNALATMMTRISEDACLSQKYSNQSVQSLARLAQGGEDDFNIEKGAPCLSPFGVLCLERGSSGTQTLRSLCLPVYQDDVNEPVGHSAGDQSTSIQQTVGHSLRGQSTSKQQAVGHSPRGQSTSKQQAAGHSTRDQSTSKQQTVGHSLRDQSTSKQQAAGHSLRDQSTSKQQAVGHSPRGQSTSEQQAVGHSTRDQSTSKQQAAGHSPRDQPTSIQQAVGHSPRDMLMEDSGMNQDKTTTFSQWLHLKGFTSASVQSLQENGFLTIESLSLLDIESLKELGLSLQQRLLLKSIIQKNGSGVQSHYVPPTGEDDGESFAGGQKVKVNVWPLSWNVATSSSGKKAPNPLIFKQNFIQVFQTLLDMIPDGGGENNVKMSDTSVDLMHSMSSWKTLRDELKLHGPESDATVAEILVKCWRKKQSEDVEEVSKKKNMGQLLSDDREKMDTTTSDAVKRALLSRDTVEEAIVNTQNNDDEEPMDDSSFQGGPCKEPTLRFRFDKKEQNTTEVDDQESFTDVVLKPDPDKEQLILNQESFKMASENVSSATDQKIEGVVCATDQKIEGVVCVEKCIRGDVDDIIIKSEVDYGPDQQPLFVIKSIQSLADSAVDCNTEKKIPIKNSCKCQYCVQVFSRTEDCQLHERTLCDKNPKRINGDKKLTANASQGAQKLFSCQYCHKQFREQANLKLHEKIHTTSCKMYTCQFCPKTFTSKNSCTLHELIHPEAPRRYYECRFCQKKFVNRLSCRKHERHHSPGSVYLCQYCDKSFHKKVAYMRHEATHTEEYPYKCSFCEERFTKKHLCARHENIHKSFQCKFCLRTFPTVYTYAAHVKKHKVSKAHKKPASASASATMEAGEHEPRVNRETLENKHTPSNEHYQCQFCSCTFYNKKKHELHEMVAHKGGALFKCQFCDKIFADRESYLQHERIHTRVQPYKCRLCTRTFAEEQDCIVHEKIHHQSDKPFKCKHCEKSFVMEELYVRHEATHMASKHYKCQFCHLLFTTKQFCLSHERSHTGLNRGYTCLYCDKTFANRKTCIAHQASHEY